MAVDDLPPFDEFVSDGSTNPRTIPFDFVNASDLIALVDGEPKVLDVDYTITGSFPNASLNPNPGFASDGATVYYYRRTSPQQDYRITSPALNRVSMEATVDRQAMVGQEHALQLTRAAQAPPGETMAALPAASQRAGAIFAFDADGNPAVQPLTDVVQQLGSSLISDGAWGGSTITDDDGVWG